MQRAGSVVNRLASPDHRVEKLEGLRVLNGNVLVGHDTEHGPRVVAGNRLVTSCLFIRATGPVDIDPAARDRPGEVRGLERRIRSEHSIHHGAEPVPGSDSPSAEHFCASGFHDTECMCHCRCWPFGGSPLPVWFVVCASGVIPLDAPTIAPAALDVARNQLPNHFFSHWQSQCFSIRTHGLRRSRAARE